MNTPTSRTPPALPLTVVEMTDIGGKLESLADDWRADPALRARCAREPREVLSERNLDISLDHDLRIVGNTDEVYHLVLPPDPNARLADEDLSSISGGSNCLGSAGTVSTAGSFPSTVSSASTAATVSSAQPSPITP